MAEKKTTAKSSDTGTEVTDYEAAQDAGYFGVAEDPVPNEEYTLTTGPDSPTAAEAHIAALRKRADDLEAEIGKEQ